MIWLEKALNRINGLHFRQEYLCLGEELHQPLQCWLLLSYRPAVNITKRHSFLGYCPLIISVPSEMVAGHEEIQIVYTLNDLDPNGNFSKKDAIAWIVLRRIAEPPLDPSPLVALFKGIKGEHRFLSAFSQKVISLQNRLFNHKNGNVFLHDDLYRQVQIAYSIPRNISLITIEQDGLYNLFPTDLHGLQDDNFYCISLRHAGKACNQVMSRRRIILSQMDPKFYKTVYALGKNHMQEPKSFACLPFSDTVSEKFKLPLPVGAVSYFELELAGGFTYGIHRLIFFRQLNIKSLQAYRPVLTHIHNAFATWRHNNRLPGNYLIR